MAINLGGVAKGYIVEKATVALAAAPSAASPASGYSQPPKNILDVISDARKKKSWDEVKKLYANDTSADNEHLWLVS